MDDGNNIQVTRIYKNPCRILCMYGADLAGSRDLGRVIHRAPMLGIALLNRRRLLGKLLLKRCTPCGAVLDLVRFCFCCPPTRRELIDLRRRCRRLIRTGIPARPHPPGTGRGQVWSILCQDQERHPGMPIINDTTMMPAGGRRVLWAPREQPQAGHKGETGEGGGERVCG